MRRLDVGERIVTSLVQRDDVVDDERLGVRVGQVVLDRLPADPAGRLAAADAGAELVAQCGAALHAAGSVVVGPLAWMQVSSQQCLPLTIRLPLQAARLAPHLTQGSSSGVCVAEAISRPPTAGERLVSLRRSRWGRSRSPFL
jgi:hypothetical protein